MSVAKLFLECLKAIDAEADALAKTNSIPVDEDPEGWSVVDIAADHSVAIRMQRISLDRAAALARVSAPGVSSHVVAMYELEAWKRLPAEARKSKEGIEELLSSEVVEVRPL